MERCIISSGGGSPPRAWGQFDGEMYNLQWRRFTPTGVGTIIHAAVQYQWYAVHPHGRGDNILSNL